MLWRAACVVGFVVCSGCSLHRAPSGTGTGALDGSTADGGFAEAGDGANGGAGTGASGTNGGAGSGGEAGGGGTSAPPPPGLASCDGFVFEKDPKDCPKECTGGCDQGLCKIDCSAGAACTSSMMKCPKGYACLVQCTGGTSCSGASVTCGDVPCDVVCSGNRACSNLVLDCSNDACRVTCDPNNTAGTNLVQNVDPDPTKNCGHSKPQCVLGSGG